MWLVVAIMAANGVAADETGGGIAPPATPPMIDAHFDLIASPRHADDRLRPLEAISSGESDSPLTVTPIDDARQRLSIGLGGSGSAKLGVAYNLSL